MAFEPAQRADPERDLRAVATPKRSASAGSRPRARPAIYPAHRLSPQLVVSAGSIPVRGRMDLPICQHQLCPSCTHLDQATGLHRAPSERRAPSTGSPVPASARTSARLGMNKVDVRQQRVEIGLRRIRWRDQVARCEHARARRAQQIRAFPAAPGEPYTAPVDGGEVGQHAKPPHR